MFLINWFLTKKRVHARTEVAAVKVDRNGEEVKKLIFV